MQNRVIKFRGFDKLHNTWIYGDLIRIPTDGGDYNTPPSSELTTYVTNSHVLTHEWVEVDPNSVGQFSGLLDKNGKEIYENDVVRLWLNDGWGSKDEYIGKIIFGNGQFMIDSLKDVVYNEPKCQYLPHNSMLLSQPELYEVITKQYISNYGEVYTFSENVMYVEIIGNLYENPDLIK